MMPPMTAPEREGQGLDERVRRCLVTCGGVCWDYGSCCIHLIRADNESRTERSIRPQTVEKE
jgi:hypothetical protein